MGVSTCINMTKRERKAPEKLEYAVPETKIKKKAAATKAPAAKKAKKADKGYKGAASAYMFFAKENRDEIVSSNPDATFGEVGKLLGAAWGEAGAKDKEKFNKLAAKDKIRAAKDKAAAGK